MSDRLVDAFTARFGEAPSLIVRAPGRVNLIGEHTDYNDGFVLPMAIERSVRIALRPRRDGRVRLHSLDMAEPCDVDAMAPMHGAPAWGEYIAGCAWTLREAGCLLAGFEGVIASDVPVGAGLSSSAALELATLRAFAAVSGIAWQPPAMARLAQRAENAWVGVQCGIMDQMISAVGEAGHAVLIDCRTLDATPVPVPAGTAVVILDTGTRRGLVDSAYNERRAQCEAAAAAFGVRALRDIDVGTFAAREHALEPDVRRRARHVVTENARTLAATAAMRAGDAVSLGALMDASHVSLRDDFAVSTEALDTMVAIARAQPGCHGARMTGAGFGGCAVALVDAAVVHAFSRAVAHAYTAATGHEPRLYVTGAAAGAGIEETTV